MTGYDLLSVTVVQTLSSRPGRALWGHRPPFGRFVLRPVVSGDSTIPTEKRDDTPKGEEYQRYWLTFGEKRDFYLYEYPDPLRNIDSFLYYPTKSFNVTQNLLVVLSVIQTSK